MATEITGTEHAAPRLNRVSLGDVTFRVPRTPTISYMFWMRGFLGRFAAGEISDDDLVQAYEETVKFLRRYNDNVDEGKLQESCELEDLITFYNRCFAADVEDEGDERPPRGSRRGTATRTGRSRSTSR